MTGRDAEGTAVDPAQVQPGQGPAEPPSGESAGRRGPSRRRLLAGAGLFGAGAVAGGLTGYLPRTEGEQPGAVPTKPVSFYGTQAVRAGPPASAAEREPRPGYTGGDLAIQACSDDPLVAFHAVRDMARIGMGVVEHNWMELGFGRTSTTSTSQATPRNLLGFKDGTPQYQGRADRSAQRARVGRPNGPALDARRQLPGGPQDPHLRGELGPGLPAGPGARHRPGRGVRRPAVGRIGVHHA
jgi:hypothetical protein